MYTKKKKSQNKKSTYSLEEGIFFNHHLIHSSFSPGWEVNFYISNAILFITPLKFNVNQLCNEWISGYQF